MYLTILKSIIFSLLSVGILSLAPSIYYSFLYTEIINPFFVCAILYLFIGVFFLISFYNSRVKQITLLDLIIFQVVWWFFCPLFASIPLLFYEYSFIDAFFEVCSALTTTGFELVNKETNISPLYLYIGLLCWAGGFFVIMFLAIIFQKLIGYELNDTEIFPIFVEENKIHLSKNILQNILSLLPIYILFTFIIFLVLSIFDSEIDKKIHFLNSMLLVSTSGFEGIGNYEINKYILSLLFIVGGLNLYEISKGKFGKENFIFILIIPLLTFIYILVETIFILKNFHLYDIERTFFDISSAITTNGVILHEQNIFALFLCASMIGGTSISSTGGFSIKRWNLIIIFLKNEINKLIYTFKASEEKKKINLVLYYFIIYIFVIGSAIVIISLFDIRLEESIILTIAMISNSGPLYESFTLGDFSLIDHRLKIFLSMLMIFGRVEILSALIVFFSFLKLKR